MSSFLSFEDVKTDKQKRSEVLRGHFAEYEIVEEVGGGVNTGAFGDVYKAVVVEVVDEKGKADKLEKGKSVIIKKSKYNPCYDNDVVYHCIKLGNFKLEIERETLLCLKDIKNVPDFLDEGKEWVCEFDTHTDSLLKGRV